MNAKTCAIKSRDNISEDTKRKLLKKSNFSCSICGKIPIVFHHIENWATKHSNDIDLLIPICDHCHRSIHGEGGNLFSKDELYEYKHNPNSPTILKDKLPLDRKKNFSFFVGSNFIENGRKANLIRFPDGSHLTSIDISTGILKLSVLQKTVSTKKFYLIKDNMLMVDPSDVWDMRYSGNSLKIWKTSNGKKHIFIDLIIRSELIVIKRMETTFNCIPFRIYKQRNPHRKKVDRLREIIRFYEEEYTKISRQINSAPKEYGNYKGLDIDALIRQHQKELIKSRCKQALYYDHYKEFKWDWPYYMWVIGKLLDESVIFSSTPNDHSNISDYYVQINSHISDIKMKYAKDFRELEDVVLKYGAMNFSGAIMVGI